MVWWSQHMLLNDSHLGAVIQPFPFYFILFNAFSLQGSINPRYNGSLSHSVQKHILWTAVKWSGSIILLCNQKCHKELPTRINQPYVWIFLFCECTLYMSLKGEGEDSLLHSHVWTRFQQLYLLLFLFHVKTF